MKLWSWGANNTDQLGHGYSSEQVSIPTHVFAMEKYFNDSNPDSVQISGGGSHTTILNAETDSCYIFHHFGLISTKYECPKEQILAKGHGGGSVSVSVPEELCSGWDYSIFLNSDGQLYSLGDNNYAQLGRKPTTSSYNGLRPNNFSGYWEEIPLSMKIKSVSSGMRHVVAIGQEEPSLISWGDNSKGQTGLNLDFKILSEPTLIQDLNFIPIKVRCTKTASIAIAQDGTTFYGCGLNKFGILGAQPAQVIPQFVEICRSETEVKDFQCGWNHVLVLLDDGRLISWGRNNFCQLGRKCSKNLEYDPTPDFVEGLSEPITSISCGSEHNLALGESGQVYSWGWNEHDNCGIKNANSDLPIPTPTKVPIPYSESGVLIGCGGGNSFVFTVSKS